MNETIFASLKEHGEKLAAPAVALGRLSVASLESLITLELATAAALADLNLARLKAAVAVNDVEGLKAFAGTQGEYVRQVSEKVVADGKTAAELIKSYSAEAQKIVKQSVGAVVPKAA